MALSSELRQVLALRKTPAPKSARKADAPASLSAAIPVEDPDDDPNPDDHLSLYIDVKLTVPPTLPPIPPAWSHLLCGRSHEAASAQYGRMALLAVGCRLSIYPSQSALEQAARCRSVSARAESSDSSLRTVRAVCCFRTGRHPATAEVRGIFTT
jgi:hypothetical protein